MTVSVVSTVLNERRELAAFLESLLSQTRLPDEIVILDGGSTDGTAEYLEGLAQEHTRLRVIVDPTCNIRHFSSPVAHGRNQAIRAATGEIIAVTDAGCVLERQWLEEILRPFSTEKPPDVVGGWYEPLVSTPFERTVAALSFPPTRHQMESVLAPSSRSIAFTKRIWERAGGYPEVALTAEDTLFNVRLHDAGARYIFASRAVVRWRPRGSLRQALRQFYRYAKGDAISGVRGRWYASTAARLCFFALVVALAAMRIPYSGYLAACVFVFYAGVLSRHERYRNTLPLSMVLKIAVDLTRLLGYAGGLLVKLRGRQW